MESSATTVSTFGEDESDGHAEVRSALTFVFCCDRLDASSVRVELDPRRPVELGRNGDPKVSVSADRSRIGLPDLRMSKHHARLLPSGTGWILEDLGSKNGTRIDGAALLKPTPLEDGCVLELGHSFFVYREDVRWRDATWEDPEALADPLVTLDASLATRLHDLGRVAPSDLGVTLQGESGVGKEVVARAIHALSERSGPFVPVNCGALPDSLVEAELFGSIRGAFSGADRDRPGFVRSADDGTLFLDEIGELSLHAQVKLLRVLQDRTVTPLGASRPVPVNFRLVTATNRDIRAAIQAGSFRGDLFARIAGFEMSLPPLRSRREDLGLLLRRFTAARGAHAADYRLTRSLARRLVSHPWPYNIRELEKGIALALTFAEDGLIELGSFPLETRDAERSAGGSQSPEDVARRRELLELMDRYQGNISQIARSMGKARMQIHRWLKQYGLEERLARARRAKSGAAAPGPTDELL